MQQYIRENGGFDVSTLKEPYRVEGKKIMAYELLADLGTVRLSQPNGERELRARIEHELGPPTVRARRREKEHTRLSHVSTAVQFACVMVRGVRGERPDTYEERPCPERTRPFLSRVL